MKVACIRIVNSVTGREESSSPWLTLGKTYVVLAVMATPERGVLFRLIGDESRTPALFDSRQFRTVSSSLASNWAAFGDEQGGLELTPESWARAGFWEDYFNQVPAAVEAFEAEAAIIMREA